MSDGNPTPRAHDGMAAFSLPDGTIRLIRNHENRDQAMVASLAGTPTTAYDVRGGGGTTTLDITVDEDGVPTLVRDFVSLNGTIVNCAGGATPWGSWLSCEESTQGVTHGWTRPHGYVFEVSAEAEGAVPAEPIRAMGRFVHEAVAIDPQTGIVYQTEDRQTAGFYRYLPEIPGRLSAGGCLQMMAVARAPGMVTSNGQVPGKSLPVHWVDIDDADPVEAERDPLAVFRQGHARGGAVFSRLEGCAMADGCVFFTATTGGNAEAGQIWQYRPITENTGELSLLFESPSSIVLDHPDNVIVSPRGGLVICENSNSSYIRGLTRDGRIFDFARNSLNGREFAGACYSPDGCLLFVNIQGDTATGGPGDKGMTFAIWGPWETGVL